MIENYTSTTTNDITNNTGYTTISSTGNPIPPQKITKKTLGDDIIKAAHIIANSIHNGFFFLYVVIAVCTFLIILRGYYK